MSTGETTNNHPTWEGAITGLLFAIENGFIARESVIDEMSRVTTELLHSGMLPNYGDLQAYLREQNKPVQLVARPYRIEDMEDPHMQCVDIVTGERRNNQLTICVAEDGNAVRREYLQLLGISDEQNEAMLRHDTGLLVIIR